MNTILRHDRKGGMSQIMEPDRRESLRSLARARLGNSALPEPKDVRGLSREEYSDYKRRTLDAVRQRRS